MPRLGANDGSQPTSSACLACGRGLQQQSLIKRGGFCHFRCATRRVPDVFTATLRDSAIHMPDLIGLALKPFERRVAIILLYIWTIPRIIYSLREGNRRRKQRRELETELDRLRDLNRELEARVNR